MVAGFEKGDNALGVFFSQIHGLWGFRFFDDPFVRGLLVYRVGYEDGVVSVYVNVFFKVGFW